MKQNPLRTLVFVVVAAVIGIVAIQTTASHELGPGPKKFDVQQLTQAVNSGEVARASWQDNLLRGDLKDGTTFVVNVPEISAAGSLPTQELLKSANVKFQIENSAIPSVPLAILAALTMPLLLLVAIYFLLVRPKGGGDSGRIAQLERALGLAHLEIQTLREALSGKTIEGLSS